MPIRICLSAVILSVVFLTTSVQQAMTAQTSHVRALETFSPEPEQLPQRGMWSEAPATRWQDGLVTGNGTLGALVFGHPTSERVVLNHERLYEPLLDKPTPVPNIAAALPEIRRLMLDGKYAKAYQFSYDAAVAAGFPGIQWTDPYHPACALLIEQSGTAAETPSSHYYRSTNFETGEIAVHWNSGDQSWVRQTFASRADKVFVQRIASTNATKISGSIRLINQDSRPANERVNEFGGGYQDPVIESSDGWISYRCKYDRSPRGYQVLLRTLPMAGQTVSKNAAVDFECQELMLLVSIESLEDFSLSDAVLVEQRQQLNSIVADYQTLLNRHAEIHGAMMGRVTLNLLHPDDQHQRFLSAEALLAKQKSTRDTEMQLALLEKMFDMGRYTLISSSGEWPPNLMGIWNGNWRPEWSGDFTLDANVNLQIAGANLGNLPEVAQSYGNLMTSLTDDWRVNAKNLYGCDGVLAGCRTAGRNNLHTHFSAGFPGHFWTAGAQWLVLPMFEHYQSTGDKKYLREKLLPMMEDIAQFYQSFLTELDERGKRIFVPSYSPENKPANTKCPAAINATMDISCAKEALSNLIFVYHELGIKTQRIAELQKLVDELPPYLINSDGALQEWSWPGLDDNYDHRHVSHLYPVWPGHEISPERTPELFAAAKVAARKRGRGNGSAHGLAHMALIGSRLKDSELVYGNLRFMLSNDYLLTSLFTFHNPGRIYNADMLHSLPAVVMEMLVYSFGDEVELLPAMAAELRTGECRGICCRNQVIIEALAWDMAARQVRVQLNSPTSQTIKLRVRPGIERAITGGGVEVAINDDGTLTIQLLSEESTRLAISFKIRE